MSESHQPEGESTVGDPVESPVDGAQAPSVDDAVSSAQESIADADQARTAVPAAAPIAEPAPAEPASEPAPAEPAAAAAPVAAPDAEAQAEAARAAAAVAAMNDGDNTPWYDRPGIAAEPLEDEPATAAPVLAHQPAESEDAEPAQAGDPSDIATEAFASVAEAEAATAVIDHSDAAATESLDAALDEAETAAATRTLAADTADDTAVTQTLGSSADDAPTVVVAPAPAPAEPEISENSVLAGPANTVYVQAPEPPRKRGNRGFSGVVALIAAVIFAIGYMAAILLNQGIDTLTSTDALLDAVIDHGTTLAFWTPVAAFFLMFWLLGVFINTARWGFWAVFSLFTGAAAVAGVAGGAILDAGPTTIAFSQGMTLAKETILTVPGFAALFLGLQLPVWLGGWIARRGRRIVAVNAEAEEEYERTLEAGPQIAP